MGEARFRRLPAAVLLAFLSIPAGPAVAQSTGSVEGQITDSDGKPMAGVTVTLLKPGQEGTSEQVSNAEGRFRFGDLAYGVYTVRASLDGYDPVTCPGGRVLPGQTRSFGIRLMPGTGEQESGPASTCTPAGAGS
jgi:hypothetical protein